MRTMLTSWPVWWLALLLVAGLILTLPSETITVGPRPLITLEANVFFEQETTLQQTIELSQPTAQASTRIWILLEPSNAPFLTLSCQGSQSAQASFNVPLPPADRAYHMIEHPWCDLADQQRVVLTLRGRGVRVMTTAVDRIPGALLKDGTPMPSSDLVLQLGLRNPGVDRYVPVTRWAADKPGLIGWESLYLLLPWLYLACVATLLRLLLSRRSWVHFRSE